MNNFIQDLKKAGKASRSIDKTASFQFMKELGGNPIISGPCSVESREK